MKNSRKTNYRCKFIAITILLIAVTNITTFWFTYDSNLNAYNAQTVKHEKAKVIQVQKPAEMPVYSSFQLDKDKVKNINRIMIVAHPDDETLWAGNHILNDKYLIVSITNGNNPTRKKEFFKAMKLSGNYGVILNYPDNPKKIKNNWKKVKNNIRQDLHYLLGYKKWDQIVTHNPEGEYGHIQHKFTSMLVTNECEKQNLTKQLNYFEKYKSAKFLLTHNIKHTLTNEQVQEKELLMAESYPSQIHAHNIFDHMMPLEKLIPYNDWYFG